MSSGSSTDRGRPADEAGFQPWQFYLLLSLGAATWAVVVSRDSHPAALLLISAGVIGAGLAAIALHGALAAFFGQQSDEKPLSAGAKDVLEREKALVLRSIKELEFDHAMRKVGDRDFAEIGARLRARAMELIQSLDRAGGQVSSAPAGSRPTTSALQNAGAPGLHSETYSALRPTPSAIASTDHECSACGTRNDADAKFCKHCGTNLT
jgi:hypothetical protein